MSRAWILLVIAGLLETVWSVGLKYSQGFSRPVPSTITMVAALSSFYLLGLALRDLPVGTAYAVWTGIGAVGAATFGILFLQESREALRLVSLVLILAGIVGLRLTSRA